MAYRCTATDVPWAFPPPALARKWLQKWMRSESTLGYLVTSLELWHRLEKEFKRDWDVEDCLVDGVSDTDGKRVPFVVVYLRK